MYELTRHRMVCALAVVLIALLAVCACLQVEVTTGSLLHGGAAVHDMAALHTRLDEGVAGLATYLPPRLGALIRLFGTAVNALHRFIAAA